MADLPVTRLVETLIAATKLAATRGQVISVTPSASLEEIEKELVRSGIDPMRMLAEAALLAFRQTAGGSGRATRNSLKYLLADTRPEATLLYATEKKATWAIKCESVLQATLAANRTIELIHDLSNANNVPIFHLLGLRNLSSFVGEVFAREIYRLHQDIFIQNPHQDGLPDLLALTPDGLTYIEERKKNGQMSDKSFWSPYPHGGIEVKATCGNTPSAKEQAKPQIGESRGHILQSAEWKAHHRETNNLLGIFWDFVDGLPTVLAAFYRNDLTSADWGEVIKPTDGGGRTTSVSIMNRTGVKKMGQGWVILPEDGQFLDPLARRKVFDISSHCIRNYCSQHRPGTLL